MRSEIVKNGKIYISYKETWMQTSGVTHRFVKNVDFAPGHE